MKDVAEIKLVALESEKCKGKKGETERWHIDYGGRKVLRNVDALLYEIARLQDCVRDATDEAIQSNIEAKMYKNMLGGRLKDTKINIGKIIKRK